MSQYMENGTCKYWIQLRAESFGDQEAPFFTNFYVFGAPPISRNGERRFLTIYLQLLYAKAEKIECDYVVS